MLDDQARPWLRLDYETIPIDETGVLVRAPDAGVRVALEGCPAPDLARLLRALDGSRTVAAVCREHGGYRGLRALLGELGERGVLRVGPGAVPADAGARRFAPHHDDPDACMHRLRASRVLVAGADGLAQRVREELVAAGVREVELVAPGSFDERGGTSAGRATDGTALVLVCPQTPRDAWIPALARALARAGVSWAPLLVFGGSGFIGPLFVPGEGPCYECLRTRERASWADPELTELYYETVARRPRANVPGASPAEAALVAAWGVVEATKYLAGFVMPAILGAFVHVELLAGRARTRRVHRVPRCPSCSPLVRRPPVDGRLLGGAP